MCVVCVVCEVCVEWNGKGGRGKDCAGAKRDVG